jgi:hypothetical protein
MVRMRDQSGQMKEATEVNINGGGELDVTAGNSTSSITAKLTMEGGGKLPPQLQLALRDRKGTFVFTEVDAKGEAKFSGVTAGPYDVTGISTTKPYAVVRMTSEAGTVAGHRLNVPAGASLNLALTLVGGSVSVEGFAKRAGKGVSGAMIVLVPKNPDLDHDRLRRDQSDLDGSFVLHNVIPGSYSVVAIEDGWALDWAQSAVLARYLQHAQPIEVGDSASAQMHLADAVVVQPK